MDENRVDGAHGGLSRAGEWDVDAAAIMEGVRDEAEPPAPGAAEEDTAEGFTLRHLGEERSVGREEAVALAQKGLDYDRVRAKLESARRELAGLRGQLAAASGGRPPEDFLAELSAKAMAEKEGIGFDEALSRVKSALPAPAGADGTETRARREAREFFAAHPDAAARLVSDRGAIPDAVWRRVRSGESLSAAWEAEDALSGARAGAARVRELERELAETRQARLNAERSTGSMGGAGGDVERDLAAQGWNAV